MNSYLLVPLRLLRLLLDLATDLLFGAWLSGSHRPPPPVSDVLLLDSATALADKIRTGRVSSRQAVEVYVKRAKEVNPVLNCYVDTRRDFFASLKALV